jgi:hypothetical protein
MRLSLGQNWTPRHERALREVGRAAREMAGETAAEA